MRQLQSWQEWNPILSRSGWMLSAHYYVKMKWPMEGFVSSICRFTISLSAITVTIRWTSEMQRWISCLNVMTVQLRFNICNLKDSQLANADIKDLPSQVKQNVSDALQYSCLHWLNHLSFPPADHSWCVLVLGRFFEGLYPLFWIEVLSIMGMIPIGVPSLWKLLSRVRVSLAAGLHSKAILTGCRIRIQWLLREFRIFVISWSFFTPLYPSALHTSIFQGDHSCPPSHLYQGSSVMSLLGPSRYKWGARHHGQDLWWSGLNILGISWAQLIHQMGPALSLDLGTQRFESGMLSLVQQLGSLLQGIIRQCIMWLTLPMGSKSSLGPLTAPFESGMLKLELWSAILSRGTLAWYSLLSTLQMVSTSSLDPPTALFESGMLRPALWLAILSRGTLTQ